jgi:hypothetical protein
VRALLVSIVLLVSSFAFASYSRSELISQYNGCVIFLKMSPAKQASVNKATGYSLAQARWACKRNTAHGQAAFLRKYLNRSEPSDGEISEGPAGRGLRCAWTAECPGIGMYNCIAGTCQPASGTNGGFTCDSAHSCAAGETCMSGACVH